MLLSEILRHIEKHGIPYSVRNFKDIEITRVSVPQQSDSHSISFFNRGLPDDFNFCYGACLVRNDMVLHGSSLRNVIQVDNPRLAIIMVAHLFKPYFSQTELSISPRTTIHPEAKIGKNVIIMDNAVLGRCTIGDYAIIYPNVVIYDDVQIGSFYEVNANTTLGAEGMGSERYTDGKIIKFPHFSNLIIKDNVFIGPNVTISRGVLTPTVIESGCTINALVHIAHNAYIGQNVVISMGAMICGSGKVGKNCFLGVGCILRVGITMGDNINVGMGAVVTKSFLEPGVTLVGVLAKIFKK